MFYIYILNYSQHIHYASNRTKNNDINNTLINNRKIKIVPTTTLLPSSTIIIFKIKWINIRFNYRVRKKMNALRLSNKGQLTRYPTTNIHVPQRSDMCRLDNPPLPLPPAEWNEIFNIFNTHSTIASSWPTSSSNIYSRNPKTFAIYSLSLSRH